MANSTLENSAPSQDLKASPQTARSELLTFGILDLWRKSTCRMSAGYLVGRGTSALVLKCHTPPAFCGLLGLDHLLFTSGTSQIGLSGLGGVMKFLRFVGPALFIWAF